MMNHPTLLKLPVFNDPRGNLVYLQSIDQFPFHIKRVYWTFDVPGGEVRGGHAHKSQEEIIISLSGSFDVVITYPDNKEVRYSLNRSFMALFVPSGTWRHIENFSTNALSLHLCSTNFDEKDYIRDFDTFKELNNG